MAHSLRELRSQEAVSQRGASEWDSWHSKVPQHTAAGKQRGREGKGPGTGTVHGQPQGPASSSHPCLQVLSKHPLKPRIHREK